MTEQLLDSAEQTFKDDFAFLERTKKIKNKKEIDPLELVIEYNVLAEKYARLLKNSVRIARMGDKAQKKLIKYKELIDTLRNI